MLTLAESERALYETMWSVEDYAKMSPGAQLVPAFVEMADATTETEWLGGWYPKMTKTTVLDAGCGSGKGAIALAKHGFKVIMCDLTPDGVIPEAQGFPFHQVVLWEDIAKQTHPTDGGKYDYVYCCDVLEHIPPTFVMLVVARLLAVARRGVFISVALQGDNFGVWVGKPLHQTVQSFVQWRDQFSALARVKECRDMLMTGVYYLEPR